MIETLADGAKKSLSETAKEAGSSEDVSEDIPDFDAEDVADGGEGKSDVPDDLKECAEDIPDFDEEVLKEYLDEVREKSAGGELPVINLESLKVISTEECKKLRAEFDTPPNKEGYIKKWEEKNGQEWPRYKEDVYSHNGKLIRQAGNRYDAHHVQPLKLGGENSAENITPMHAKDHYDKQGVHRPNGPYGKLSNPSSDS